MKDSSLTTGVDALLLYLHEHEKVALPDLAKELQMSEETVKLWIDFLMEEKIVGIEYKFTKPFIYLNKPDKQKKAYVVEKHMITLEAFKKDFVKRAETSGIPTEQIETYWRNHLMNQIDLKKHFFIHEARKRGLTGIDELWSNYRESLLLT